MKDEFKGFYSLNESERRVLWDKAVFVFDANVLLNLYRYQESTTEQLLFVIDKLKDRVWIPYHVALEYQRNRLKVISDQNVKFSDVSAIVKKGSASIRTGLDNLNLRKRHSTIAPEIFLQSIDDTVNKFLSELDELEKAHYSVLSEDKIRLRLENLLAGNIGKKPVSQEAVDKLEKEADKRYINKQPPGYMDEKKERAGEPVFSYGSINYQRKYSDYVVWSQILEYASKNGLTDLVFVTDDSKEDWWLKVSQNGEKTISPRPELTSEIFMQTGVERFHMYSSDGFLKYSNEMLSFGVTEAAIEEVRDVSRVRDISLVNHEMLHESMHALEAVTEWLSRKYGSECVYISNSDSGFDIEATLAGKNVAFDIKIVKSSGGFVQRLPRLLDRTYKIKSNSSYDNVVIVAIVMNHDAAVRVANKLAQMLEKGADFPDISVYIGSIAHMSTGPTPYRYSSFTKINFR